MNIFKELKRQWCAETPKVYKWIRNIAGIITAVVPSSWGVFILMSIQMPEWFTHSVGFITFTSLIITGIAGTKEKKV